MFIGLSKKRCFEVATGLMLPDDNHPETGGMRFCADDTDCMAWANPAICGKTM